MGRETIRKMKRKRFTTAPLPTRLEAGSRRARTDDVGRRGRVGESASSTTPQIRGKLISRVDRNKGLPGPGRSRGSVMGAIRYASPVNAGRLNVSSERRNNSGLAYGHSFILVYCQLRGNKHRWNTQRRAINLSVAVANLSLTVCRALLPPARARARARSLSLLPPSAPHPRRSMTTGRYIVVNVAFHARCRLRSEDRRARDDIPRLFQSFGASERERARTGGRRGGGEREPRPNISFRYSYLSEQE